MATGEKQGGLRATLRGITLPLARATINVRLIAIVLGLAVPLNVVVAVVIWRLAGDAFDAQCTSLVYAGRSLANGVDAVFSKYVSLAQVLANDPDAQGDSIETFEDELRHQFAPLPETSVEITEPDGRPLLRTSEPRHTPSAPLPPEAADGQRRALETGDVVISDIYRDPADDSWVASANVAVFKDGKPFRGLAVTLNTRRFVDLLAVQDLPKNWVAIIRDASGRIVARVPAPDQWVGLMVSSQFMELTKRTGLFRTSSRTGAEYITANAQTSPAAGWTVGVGVRTADLRAGVINAIGWPLALGGAISLLSIAFALSIARRITTPLTELRQKAVAVLEDPNVAFEPGVPELGELWTALAHAAANRHRSEARARATEKRLSQIINNFSGYVGLLDRDGRIVEANVQMLRAIGAPREQVLGQAFADVGLWTHSPQARREMRDLIGRCLDGATVRRDLQYTSGGGDTRWIAFQATPLRGADGRIDGVVPSGYDITDRKAAEGALHRSEARFRRLYDHMLAGVLLSDWEGRIIASNPAFCNLVGYTEAELVGMNFAALVHPDDGADDVAHVRSLARGDVKSLVFENRFIHRNGTPVWARKLISSLPVQPGEAQQLFMVCIDMSPRKQMEEELRESEARLKLALEAGGAGMWEKPIESDALIVSERARQLYGLPRGIALTRDHVHAATDPEDRPKVIEAMRAALDTGAPFSVEIRCPQPDGSVRWLHSQGEVHELGGRRRLIGLVRDISRRKLAEQTVRTSRMRLQLALDAARLGWWLYDPRQRAISWDSRLTEIFGIATQTNEVATILDRIIPEDRNIIRRAVTKALDHHTPDPFFRCEFRILRGTADIRWVEAYGMVTFEGIGDPPRGGIVGTVADITERKHAEEQQQLSMRELSHRTKNLLSVVQSIANQTAASSPSGFVERFSERIRALSASIDLLVHSEWRGVEIEALVRAQLAHFADLIGVRIMIAGPPLSVLPAAAQSIGMALHELATNAGKYGSLSDDHGRVTIDWRHDGAVFSIGWLDRGGPAVKPPERQGFGTTIITTVVEQNTAGAVELAYEPEGFAWRLTCAATRVLSPVAVPGAPAAEN